jgi:L-lactate permease
MANTLFVAIAYCYFTCSGSGVSAGVFHGLYAGLEPVTLVVSGKLGLGDGEKKGIVSAHRM